VVLFLGGFAAFFFITDALLSAKLSDSLAPWLIIVIAVGVGLVGGILFVVLKKVGVFLFGFLLGIILGALVIGATPLGNLFTNNVIPLVIILCVGLIVAIATVFLERHLLIIGTSVNGAYMVGSTIDDLWIHSSFASFLPNMISNFGEKIPFSSSWQPYTVLAAVVLLAMIGIVVQYKTTLPADEEKKDKPDETSFLMQPNV